MKKTSGQKIVDGFAQMSSEELSNKKARCKKIIKDDMMGSETFILGTFLGVVIFGILMVLLNTFGGSGREIDPLSDAIFVLVISALFGICLEWTGKQGAATYLKTLEEYEENENNERSKKREKDISDPYHPHFNHHA